MIVPVLMYDKNTEYRIQTKIPPNFWQYKFLNMTAGKEYKPCLLSLCLCWPW